MAELSNWEKVDYLAQNPLKKLNKSATEDKNMHSLISELN